eukprot:9503861-Pyramimonas_sp.AAC.1
MARLTEHMCKWGRGVIRRDIPTYWIRIMYVADMDGETGETMRMTDADDAGHDNDADGEDDGDDTAG